MATEEGGLTVISVRAGIVAPPGWAWGVVWMRPPAVGVEAALTCRRWWSPCAETRDAPRRRREAGASMIRETRREGRKERPGGIRGEEGGLGRRGKGVVVGLNQ